MREIVIKEPAEYGPVSTQLQRIGADISDSWFKSNQNTIWEEFKLAAPEYYREVACEELGGEDECQLCAHDIHIGCTVEAIVEPFVANHPELDMVITWPRRMVLGSTCVQMLGLESYVMRFVRSCASGLPKIKTNEHGLVRIGSVVGHPSKWTYNKLVLPHSVFTTIPADIMEECGIRFHELANPFDPKGRLERTLKRSFRSKTGKWRDRGTVEPSEVICNGKPHNMLATVLHREDVVRIKEVFKTRENR